MFSPVSKTWRAGGLHTGCCSVACRVWSSYQPVGTRDPAPRHCDASHPFSLAICVCVFCLHPPGPQILTWPFLTSCPDKNKVHFNPTGSAFCPVSVKPLFPSMGFIFRSCPSSPGSPLPSASSRPPPRKDPEASKASSLPFEPWQRTHHQKSLCFSRAPWWSEGALPPLYHGDQCLGGRTLPSSPEVGDEGALPSRPLSTFIYRVKALGPLSDEHWPLQM